jgi:hypothetical protein
MEVKSHIEPCCDKHNHGARIVVDHEMALMLLAFLDPEKYVKSGVPKSVKKDLDYNRKTFAADISLMLRTHETITRCSDKDIEEELTGEHEAQIEFALTDLGITFDDIMAVFSEAGQPLMRVEDAINLAKQRRNKMN